MRLLGPIQLLESLPDPHRGPNDDVDEDELLDGLDETNLRLLDAVFYNAGIVASEDLAPPSANELEDEAALGRFVEALVRSK